MLDTRREVRRRISQLEFNSQRSLIKVFVSCYIPHNNSLCLIDKEVLNYYRQLLNKQGGKQ